MNFISHVAATRRFSPSDRRTIRRFARQGRGFPGLEWLASRAIHRRRDPRVWGERGTGITYGR